MRGNVGGGSDGDSGDDSSNMNQHMGSCYCRSRGRAKNFRYIVSCNPPKKLGRQVILLLFYSGEK